MARAEEQPRFGERRLVIDERTVVDVMAIAGEDVPTWVLWKNATPYAVVQQLGEGRFWFGGSVAVGAEPVDRQLAARALYCAVP